MHAARRTTRWGLPAALALVVACASPGPETPEVEGPETVSPIIARAERLRARGDYDTAIAAYREALERTPWNDRIQRALATTYAERAGRRRTEGDRAAAEADLRAAVALYPDDTDLRRNLGVVLLERAVVESDPARARALREEASGLAPDLDPSGAVLDAGLERRIDLALELIESGRVEAGIDALERLHASVPGNAGVARLLAQSHVRLATERSQRANFVGAGRALDRAAELYRELGDCEDPRCEREELRLAHHNRVVAWINASDPAAARRALAEAAALGLRFPQLEGELAAMPGAGGPRR